MAARRKTFNLQFARSTGSRWARFLSPDHLAQPRKLRSWGTPVTVLSEVGNVLKLPHHLLAPCRLVMMLFADIARQKTALAVAGVVNTDVTD